MLINKRETTELKYLNDSKGFIEYSNDTDDIHKNIEEYSPNKQLKILLVLDDMIVDMLSNKKLNPIVTDLFTRGRKLNISLVFITQSYFAAPKNVRLNSTQYFILKMPTKENFKKLCLIIHQIFIFKTILIFIKSDLQNHIHFWLFILLLHQIIHFTFQKKYFRNNIKLNYDN